MVEETPAEAAPTTNPGGQRRRDELNRQIRASITDTNSPPTVDQIRERFGLTEAEFTPGDLKRTLASLRGGEVTRRRTSGQAAEPHTGRGEQEPGSVDEKDPEAAERKFADELRLEVARSGIRAAAKYYEISIQEAQSLLDRYPPTTKSVTSRKRDVIAWE